MRKAAACVKSDSQHNIELVSN